MYTATITDLNDTNFTISLSIDIWSDLPTSEQEAVINIIESEIMPCIYDKKFAVVLNPLTIKCEGTPFENTETELIDKLYLSESLHELLA